MTICITAASIIWHSTNQTINLNLKGLVFSGNRQLLYTFNGATDNSCDHEDTEITPELPLNIVFLGNSVFKVENTLSATETE